MAKISLPKESGKWSKVREKSVKSQGMLKRILSGNPDCKLIGTLIIRCLVNKHTTSQFLRFKVVSKYESFLVSDPKQQFS